MAIITTITELFKKVLTIGTPKDDDVLYKKVIKRKVPDKSAEALVVEDFKNVIQNTKSKILGVATPPEESNVSPETKTVTKKKTTTPTKPKKSTSTKTKTTTTKKAPTKKSATKKKVIETKSTAASKTATTKKSPAKKSITKKTTTAKKTVTKTTKVSTKTPVTKKKVAATTKKITTKTSINKKATPTKKTAVVKPKKEATKIKTTTVLKGTKKAAKIALYTKDVKKRYGEVDEDFLAIIVKNLGPSIYRKDAELVSCSDPKELDTVRKNFLIKKLGLEVSKDILNAAIKDVCEELQSTRQKYRATFYYSLAKKFRKESALS